MCYNIEVIFVSYEGIFSTKICKLSVFLEVLLLQCSMCDALCAADHDLTGQIVWPAAQVCNCFVVRNLYICGTLTPMLGLENLRLQLRAQIRLQL